MPSPETQIANLMARYEFALDDGDINQVEALLANADYILTARNLTISGPEAIGAFCRDTVVVYDDGTPRTQHVVSNLLIDVDETTGTATARSYFTVLQATDGFPLQVIIAGTYRDKFAVKDGQWAFTERSVNTTLRGDITHHAKPLPT